MNKVIVTTSWDDGHILDVKLADLLQKYNLGGTFYISPENREINLSQRLTAAQVLSLASTKNFEVGAHTMTHPRLSKVSNVEAKAEIENSKKVLEQWTGQEVKSFCYPGGDFKPEHKQMVKDAGFILARTTKRFAKDLGPDAFELPTTVHAYKHWSDAVDIFTHTGTGFLNDYLNWDKLATDLFDTIIKTGGVFHLWGHSWEIEKNNDWERLEKVFKHISHRPEVIYVSNKELYGQ